MISFYRGLLGPFPFTGPALAPACPEFSFFPVGFAPPFPPFDTKCLRAGSTTCGANSFEVGLVSEDKVNRRTGELASNSRQKGVFLRFPRALCY
jgi:hypothetical protein